MGGVRKILALEVDFGVTITVIRAGQGRAGQGIGLVSGSDWVDRLSEAMEGVGGARLFQQPASAVLRCCVPFKTIEDRKLSQTCVQARSSFTLSNPIDRADRSDTSPGNR